MANITAVQTISTDYITATWSGMAQADVGVGVRLFRYGDKTAQSYLGAGGQFGTSSIFVEGSNNSTDGIDGAWTYVTDPQGTNINLSQVNSGTNMEAMVENPAWARPRVGTGTGSLVAVAMFGIRH